MNHVIEEKKPLGEQFREFFVTNANLLLAAAIALLLLSDVFGTHGVLAMRRSQQQATDIQKQIDQLNQQNKQLEGRVKSLKTDPSAVENIARVEMGLAKPGEVIFKVPSRENGDPDSASSTTSGNTQKP
jgi:cell division protein FtsB